jgi:hypothetical protein
MPIPPFHKLINIIIPFIQEKKEIPLIHLLL